MTIAGKSHFFSIRYIDSFMLGIFRCHSFPGLQKLLQGAQKLGIVRLEPIEMAEKYMGNWGYTPPCWSFFNGKTHNQLQRWKSIGIDARPGQRGESHAAAAVP